jgi:hypothetical protein
MQYRNIKVKVPTPEISRMVQEKLFEHGVRWRYAGSASVRHEGEKYLYVDDSLKMTQGGFDQEYFNQHNHKQVHYLQILTGDDTGRLFKTDSSLIHAYYQIGENAHWVYCGELISHRYNLDGFLKAFNSVKLINVNEEEITMQSNKMPKLEAGKHVVKMKDGREALVLAGDALLYLNVKYANVGEFNGWELLPKVSDNIECVYEIECPSQTVALNLLTQHTNKNLTLIWKRDNEADKRREEYEQLQRQIAELQSQANKLGESL